MRTGTEIDLIVNTSENSELCNAIIVQNMSGEQMITVIGVQGCDSNAKKDSFFVGSTAKLLRFLDSKVTQTFLRFKENTI